MFFVVKFLIFLKHRYSRRISGKKCFHHDNLRVTYFIMPKFGLYLNGWQKQSAKKCVCVNRALVCQHPLTKERKSAPTLTYRWLTVGFFGFTTRTGPHSVRKKSVLFNLIQHLYTNIINGTVGAWTKVVKLETLRLWVNFLHSHHSCLLIRWVIHSIYLIS